ncbi:aldehyde dehydrogenase family protein [Streptomyces sp. NPDC046909]|uniref:aldehyde dehydrogenase family protein n=1 Tax=Streptomyces sp. NPDC046909 TaxID=3155617 RepID=UPI00340D8AB3
MSDFTMTIDGAAASAADTFDVVNPATAEVFAQAPVCDRAGLDAAMAAAATAYRAWQTDDKARRVVLREMADALQAATDRLAPVLTAEQGKPLGDARTEIFMSVLWLRYYADLDLPREVVQDDEQGFAEVVRRPLGVVAAITPWNFPLLLAMWKIAPALRAGNTMVLKPSPYTPLSALVLGEVWRNVVPPGVFNVVTGPEPLGTWLTGHPAVRKVSFTGSTSVGKKVAAATAEDLKRVTLELGGNDPAIVLEDADPRQIAESLFWGAFRNNGQVCLAVKRVYVHERHHADLVEALAEQARSVRVGDGTTEGVQLGPVNNRPQFDRVRELVDDALGNGAVAVAGGAPLDGPGYFYAPTILTGVTDDSRIVAEEQFGPALPVLPYRDLDDVVGRANATEYGLTASVWSPDLDRASSVASRLDCGQVSVNAHGGAVRPNLPFGGHKWSGLGVENGPWGLYGFTDLQVLARPARRSPSDTANDNN